MNDDRDFIRAIAADPADNTLRLVYADWLEERGDGRAEFLRLEAELAGKEARDRQRLLESRRLDIHVAVDPRRYLAWLEETGGTRAECEHIEDELLALEQRFLQHGAMRLRLDALRKEIDPRWLAELDHPPVENCQPRFQFRCPKEWQRLTRTADSQVRFCDHCRKNVYYCGSVREARDHARQGHCVAVNSHQMRAPGDLDEEYQIFETGSLAVEADDNPDGGFLGMPLEPEERSDVVLEESDIQAVHAEADELMARHTARLGEARLPTNPKQPWWKFW
jgi:uncharacterized protein (TIGR02996 family)